MSANEEELARLEKLIEEKKKKEAEEAKAKAAEGKHIRLVKQSREMKEKARVIASLLANIGKTDLVKVCESLGWKGNGDELPKPRHFKVAIVDVLLETAKKHNWHIIHNDGFFYIYNGAYWVVLLNSEFRQLLKAATFKMNDKVIEGRESTFLDRLFKQAIYDSFFDELNYTRQSIINLKNGSLVLSETGVTLKPFDYRDFLTYQLDFEHDPKAINNRFLRYLKEVLPDAGTRRTLQQVAGYLFIKGLKMENIFFLYGTGSNGKSVFFEVINGILGTENISHYSLESLTDDKGYHRSMIKNKIVNYGTDISLKNINTEHFKKLASGEPIEARLPYRIPFIMTDYAKLIFNINRLDFTHMEHTLGFQRKFLIIPFSVTIPEEKRDKDLHKTLLRNRAGILNWIIEGAEQVIKNRTIFVSEECANFRIQFDRGNDSVAMFEEHLAETMTGTTYSKTVTDAYQEYKAFCLEDGYDYPLGRTQFSRRMETLGFNKSKQEKGKVFEKKF